MSFSKAAEYFYVSASTLPSDAGVYSHLANDDNMKAFEAADAAFQDAKQRGTDAERAASMVTQAEVALAYEEIEQATQLAEGALDDAKKAGNVKIEAAAMNVIAKAMIWWAPEEAVVKAKDTMDVAKASGDVHTRACVHFTLSLALMASGQSNQAVVVGHDMQSLYAGTDAIGEGCAVLCVSELQMQSGDQRAAMQSAKNAIEILEKANNVSYRALAMKSAASAALSSTNTASEGFLLADEALNLFDVSSDPKSSISLKLDMANARLRSEDYVEAEDLAEDAERASKRINNMSQEADCAAVLAAVRLAIAVADSKEKDEADTASATASARDALVLYRKLGNRRGEAAAMYKLAQVRYQSGAGDMAKMAAEEAQGMYRELQDVSGEAGAVLLIAHVLHNDQQFDAAKRSATKAFTLYQSIGGQEGMEECTEFLDKVKSTQSEKSRTDKAAKKTVSDSGLVKLVNSVEESTHLLSFFADMNEDEDTELGEFDLKEWGSAMDMLKIQS